MTFKKKTTLAAVLALIAMGAAHADITIGVVQPLTGPASGLGIPVKNGIMIWPKTIAGETLKIVVLDDATDPTTGVKDAQRLVTEDKADVIVGSSATPVAIPMADVTAEAGTPQLSTAPAGLPPGKDKWFFRLPQSNDVMAYAVVAHMKKQNVKTVGFLGYTDAYGELWLKALTAEAAKNGIKIVATERFARSDTSVTGQVLKLTSANPDAILIVASGSGAGMPQKAVMERGFKGKIYQTHAAATQDLMRTAGKDAEGTFVVSGPATVAEQLPDSHPSKAAAVAFVQGYEKATAQDRATSSPATRPTRSRCSKRPCRSRSRRASPARRSSAPRCATRSRTWAARCSRTACSTGRRRTTGATRPKPA